MILKSELEQAKSLLNHISQDNTLTYREVFLVAKYYRYAELSVKPNVEAYIRARAFQYNESVYERWIDMALEGVEKYKLRILDRIPVTEHELGCFWGVYNEFGSKTARLLFAMWVSCKYSVLTSSVYTEGNLDRIRNFYIMSTRKQLCEIAKMNYLTREQYDTLWTNLYVGGYLILFGHNREALDQILDFSGETKEEIVLDEDMVFWLEGKFGRKDVFQCQRCGKWKKSVSPRVTNQKYCHECRLEIDREKDAMKKRRKRKK